MTDFFLVTSFGVIVLGGIFLLFQKKKKITPANFELFRKKINETKNFAPPHALFEAHKLFISAVATLFPTSKDQAIKMLQRVSKRFPNEEKIWQFHKLRNRVAHEPDCKVTSQKAEEAREEFIRALESLL
jgi:hypothetical protein